MAENKLKEFLDKGKDWERLPTTVPGVYVLKLPKYQKSPPRLAVELNPADRQGNPTKKRGLVLRTSEELDALNQLFQYERLRRLLGMLDTLNQFKASGDKDKVIEL